MQVFQRVAPTPAAGAHFRMLSILLAPIELEKPCKMGTVDDSVMTDTDPEIHPGYATIITGRNRSDPPLGSAADDANVLNLIVTKFNLAVLHPYHYALRQGGP